MMHKTPAVVAGVSDQRGSDPGIPTTIRPKLNASTAAKAHLRWLRRLEPFGRASR